ncbi:MAG TPA: Abi family protein [Candidatus Fimihabitans intestinipullorum]|uniref:Abi family protein n=1 Tax=Candidatus Fimihabitans intestinipullorum TaxID=2840820 RepID=A0A9D1HVL2_9BACT|nr:Abi family protein [Candidatus Fimihabitans intestinipullorum]
MKSKIFKTLDEQIDILKARGLVIDDVEYAKEILFRENYFFVSGYRHLFMRKYNDDQFLKGTRFDELYAAFVFDRKLRNIMFKYILVIENNIKSIISYQMSKKYGYKEKDYLDPKNFTQDSLKSRQVYDILNKTKRQIRINGKEHTATMHYLSNYGYIPMWILVKVLSFGIVSELYSILKLEDQEAIASFYHLDAETLAIYLSLLANFRNLCAHEEVLYDHRTQKEIPDTKYHELLDIPKEDGEYIYGKNDLFVLPIIMKQMLTEGEFRELIYEIGYEIDVLDGIVDVVPLHTILNKIGFPNNWRELIKMD